MLKPASISPDVLEVSKARRADFDTHGDDSIQYILDLEFFNEKIAAQGAISHGSPVPIVQTSSSDNIKSGVVARYERVVGSGKPWWLYEGRKAFPRELRLSTSILTMLIGRPRTELYQVDAHQTPVMQQLDAANLAPASSDGINQARKESWVLVNGAVGN
jgi:hypothetical protein